MQIGFIDFFIFLFFMQIILLILNNQTGLNLLILSELCWITLYCLYLIFGLFFSSLIAYTIALPLLVFAAVDCSIWLLFLVYFFFNGTFFINTKKFDIKYLFRSKRLLQTNKYIK